MATTYTKQTIPATSYTKATVPVVKYNRQGVRYLVTSYPKILITSAGKRIVFGAATTYTKLTVSEY